MMRDMATRDAYGEALVKLAESNKKVVVLDADLSGSTRTSEFKKVAPERFFNIGIAEQNLMGVAAGFAAAGKIPFASTFAIFAAGRAYDQVRNSIAYPGLNVKIAATHAGLTVGEDGGSHQMLEDIALMRVIPGMTVLVPADGEEARQAVLAAAEHDGPTYIRLGRSKVKSIFDDNYEFRIGKAALLREGSDLTFIATGIMVEAALGAAAELAEKGISARVLNMSTIKPLDKEAIIKAAAETGKIVVCEEHSTCGGLGSAVSEAVVTEHPVPCLLIGVDDVFGRSGKPEELLREYGLDTDSIIRKTEQFLNEK